MKTIEINLYKLSELSEEAKERAYNDWLSKGRDYPWDSENRGTLEKFAVSFNVTVNHWQYDTCSGYVRFSLNWPDEVENLTGVRLATFLWNNFKSTLFSGKYRSMKSTQKITHKRVISLASKREPGKYYNSYRSAIMLEHSCELTGYCADEDILGPIYDFLNKPENITFYELIDRCFDAWVKYCVNDADYSTSMEYFEDEAEANDWDFEENGEMRY